MRALRLPSVLAALAALIVVTTGPVPQQQETFESLARTSLAQIDGAIPLSGLKDSVEIIRDRWGVPHIYARNIDDLFFAQGFVQAQDRLWQMEMYRRTYEGTLSEIMGATYVRHDQVARLLKFRGPFNDAEWKSYHPEGRRIFDAFANGVNAFIAVAGDRLPVEFRLTGIRPQPWTADVALLRTQTAMPTADATSELSLARNVVSQGVEAANRAARPSPYRDLVVPSGVDLSQISQAVSGGLSGMRTGAVRPELLPQYRAMTGSLPNENTGAQENSPGSNNWVLSGKLTASGKAIVANDPHRSIGNPSIRYIVHLNAPGWNVIGATEPPLPGVAIGHNGRLAWGLTIVGTDQSDVYVEEVNPANRNQVRFRGQWEALRVTRDTIFVKGAAPVVVEQKFSRHGPVFYEDTVNRKAYAIRSTMHEPGSAGYMGALRYHALDNCTQFLDAQKYFLAPTENMICGDTAGNVAWQASAASPRRPNWHGRLPVPGTGEYEWNGLRDDLPREFNPARGWIATANHDIHPAGYDPPLFFKNGPATERFDRISQVLTGKTGFTMTDMQALQHDAYSAAAARDIPLFRGWTSSDADIERARAALAGWDAQHRRESMAAAVYRFVSREITTEARAATTTADARRTLLESAIKTGLVGLRQAQGNDPAQWRWGPFNTSQMPHSLVRAYDIAPVERHGGAGFVAAVGATYREIIDLGNIEGSLATNVPGQSGQPGSPYYSNLVDGFGRGEYFPLAYSRAAVDKVAEHRLVLRPRDARSALNQTQPAQASRPPANTIPSFVVDSTWPKDLPPTWTWRRPTEPQSDVLGINADSHDYIWITHRNQIAEYNADGTLIKVLPRPGDQGQYTTIHGMYLDHKGNMWTTAREEHQVLKLTLDGKVLLAIGENRVTAGSNDTLHMGRPAEVYVDAQTNELYVADGYTNHRVVVFDAETGKYLRHWGAYGKRPDDTARDRPVAGENAKVSQFNIPHGITGSRDGLIYLADRTNSRIQVFKRNGEYVTEAFTRTGTGGAFSVALSPDPAQEFVYVTDGTQHRIWILRRSTMAVVGQFAEEGHGPGQVGRPHNITTDSRGNVYVAEADPGRRVQKFVFKGWVPK